MLTNFFRTVYRGAFLSPGWLTATGIYLTALTIGIGSGVPVGWAVSGAAFVYVVILVNCYVLGADTPGQETK